MTQEQRDDARYEAIIIVNELHKTKDCSVYCRLIDLIDILGLPAETCTVEQAKDARCGRCGAMEPVLDHLFNTFAAGYFGEELRHAISNVWRKWETWDKEADE